MVLNTNFPTQNRMRSYSSRICAPCLYFLLHTGLVHASEIFTILSCGKEGGSSNQVYTGTHWEGLVSVQGVQCVKTAIMLPYPLSMLRFNSPLDGLLGLCGGTRDNNANMGSLAFCLLVTLGCSQENSSAELGLNQ